MNIKEKIKHQLLNGNPYEKKVFQSLRPIWNIFVLLTTPRIFWEKVTGLKYGTQHFQGSTFTLNNRYPSIFKYVSEQLMHHHQPSILSFGCATGEEVRSIGQLLPHAQIIGIDINPWCIKQSKQKNRSPKHEYFHRNDQKFLDSKHFDAIFCMAVFQKTENRTKFQHQITTGFQFTQFENELIFLDAKLKVEGLLIIDHADFNFLETCISSNYIIVEFEQNSITRNRPVFNRQNQIISDTFSTNRVFKKIR